MANRLEESSFHTEPVHGTCIAIRKKMKVMAGIVVCNGFTAYHRSDAIITGGAGIVTYLTHGSCAIAGSFGSGSHPTVRPLSG